MRAMKANGLARNVGARGPSIKPAGLLKAGKLIFRSDPENMHALANNTLKSTKLFITNLDSKVNDTDICELFSEIGIIREACVHYNCWGYSLGTAHVVYLNPEHAAEAARRYNGIPLDGKPMTITMEGSPYGNKVKNLTLPVKMRLSFGPNHNTKGVPQNPFSQVNRGSALLKTPKRLGKGSMKVSADQKGVSRGRGKPKGRPAVARGRGSVLTAAELDLELEEYLQSKGKKSISSAANDEITGSENQEIADDFGELKDVLEETAEPMDVTLLRTPKITPGKVGRPRKTPSNTPSTKSKNKTPSKVMNETPAKTPNKTPAKTKTPVTKTPKITPAKTPKKTPAKTPKKTPPKTPNNISTETPRITPAKTPKKTPAKTTNEAPAQVATSKPRGRTPGKFAKQSKTPSSKGKGVALANYLENSPVSAVPKSVTKGTPRRSGRMSKID